MILLLKTDNPVCEMALASDAKTIRSQWPADRNLARDLLGQLETFLGENDTAWHTLSGLVVFRGPGSFTGLRIAATVMNTLADSLAIPIVGTLGNKWESDGLGLLKRNKNHRLVLPEYGSLPNVTRPKK